MTASRYCLAQTREPDFLPALCVANAGLFELRQRGRCFQAQPSVINGFSDTMGEIFQERGVHARSAVGTNAVRTFVFCELCHKTHVHTVLMSGFSVR